MQHVISFSFTFFCKPFCKRTNNPTDYSALPMSLHGIPDHWKSTVGLWDVLYYYRIFPPEIPIFYSKAESSFLCSYSSKHHGHILSVGRGSSRPSTQLLLRRVAVAAAAACWAPGARAQRYTEGSIKTASCPQMVKEVVLVHFNSKFCHFPAKQLEKNSVGTNTSVVAVCDQNKGSWSSQGFDIGADGRPCPSSFPLNNVYIESLGILYIKCNVVNEPEVTHRKPVEKISCRYETQPCSIWL